MSDEKRKLRVAMPAWEIGRVNSGFGTKIGGLGGVIEELPQELVKAAARQNIDLEVIVLSPCFAHYDRRHLTPLNIRLPVTVNGISFEFEAYRHVFEDGQIVIYFWDDGQLHWTTPSAVYPNDPQMAFILYAAVSQAMAGYIRQSDFDTVHLHDYHVGLIPFYLGDDYLSRVPVHFTIHNASYQGITPIVIGGYETLERINLPGHLLFHKYFDFMDRINLMKACMLKIHETGGKITTVSGDIGATWGYAAELKQNLHEVMVRAYLQKKGPPGEVFLPNRNLDLFEKLPVIGITNGLSDRNRPEHMPELKAEHLRTIQQRRGWDRPLFINADTQSTMLEEDHHFDLHRLHVKAELKRLLHLETFHSEPMWNPILITAVGRLVHQKNFDVIADIIDQTLHHHAGVKFIILASPTEGDPEGHHRESIFFHLRNRYPHHVYFNSSFNLPLSKLILAGGDFTLVPSRFEPCGLVDYESSLLGNIVIGRATGGLVKVGHCAYLYDWLDVSDRIGEANAFYQKIDEAISNYRHNPGYHHELIRRAMSIDASWDNPASDYIAMYRYGLLAQKWYQDRRNLIDQFITDLQDDRDLFKTFFHPGTHEFGDHYDWQLKNALK